MTRLTTRRDSLAAAIGMTAAVAIGAQASSAADAADLQSEFLFDLALTALKPAEIAPDRMVVAVSGGTFEGPRLKGTIIGPAGDWMVQRNDGSRLLDVRALLQTDDGQRVYMMCRGIAYTPPGGTLHARILCSRRARPSMLVEQRRRRRSLPSKRRENLLPGLRNPVKRGGARRSETDGGRITWYATGLPVE